MPIITRQVIVAASSLNQTPLDWEGNKKNILFAIHEARSLGVQMLCCPELCITGYGCEDSFLSVSNCQMALNILKEILPETKNIVVALGLPILYRDGLYNTACLIVNGKIVGFVAKQYLAGEGIHYEPRWFKPWPQGLISNITIFGNEHYPIGDLVFDINDLRLGFEICEDAWVATRTGIQLANRGVDILFNPSASHFAFGKSEIRKRFVQEAARAFCVGYVYANLLGNEAGRIIYDGDTIIAAGQKLIAEGPRFSFQDFIVTSAILDIEELRIDRASNTNYPKIVSDQIDVIHCPIDFKSDKADKADKLEKMDKPNIADKLKSVHLNSTSERSENQIDKNAIKINWESAINEKINPEIMQYQEFTRAASLGLFDYMRKSRSNGFVLNLSGGADSASCACLVFLMVNLALRELGSEKFKAKLSYFTALHLIQKNEDQKNKVHENKSHEIEIQNSLDSFKILTRSIMPELLFCIYQRTQYSSSKTENAAKALAQALNAGFADLDIDSFVKNYVHLMESVIKRPLNWKDDDVALQNIQCRVRAPGTWILANIRNALFLCASNRSEASLGYATMDGDTCGGLAPIAGVSKAFLKRWLKWLEEGGLEEIGPTTVLEQITSQSPTAELKPESEHQTDEADLMPYEWIDTIEKLFVHDKRSPIVVFKELKNLYPDHDPHLLKAAVVKFFKLWAQNQWKRERLAVAFHLDDQSVDPKTWCRYPVLSGNFLRELRELEELKD